MGRLENKVAILTGGAGGIGTAIAASFVREGAKLLITDLDETGGEALAARLGCEFLVQDVTDEAGWSEIVATVEQRHGALHVLVNNAGIEGEVSSGTPEETSYEDWKKVHAVNLDGVFLGCRAALPAMRRAGGGSIVNLSSIVALFATPNSAAYGSSKAGVRHLTMTVASHGAQNGDGIRCNSVHPGLIRTRMLMNIHAAIAKRRNISREEATAASVSRVPLGEMGEPEDVADMVLFLASEESKYVTGAGFHVDGGWNLS